MIDKKNILYIKHNNNILPYYFLELLKPKKNNKKIEYEILESIKKLYDEGKITLQEKCSRNKYFFEYIINPFLLWDKDSKDVEKNNEIFQNLYIKSFIFPYIKIFPKSILNLKNMFNQDIISLLSSVDLKKLFSLYNEDNEIYFKKLNLNNIDDFNIHYITKILNIDFLDDGDIYILDVLINKLNIDLTVEITDKNKPLYQYIEQSFKTQMYYIQYSHVNYYNIFEYKLKEAAVLYEKKKINLKIDKNKRVFTQEQNPLEEEIIKRL